MTKLLQFEVITFDCYGTLVDWESGILAAFRYAERDLLGGVRDEEILAAYADCEAALESQSYLPYREILNRAGLDVVRRLGKDVKSVPDGFLSASLRTWEPFPDTVNALRRLRTRYKLGVISNVDRDLFAATNEKLGGPFTFIVTAEDVRSYKPSHKNFQYAADVIGVRTDKWLHAAQSLYHDAKPCNELGIASAWIDRHAGKDWQGAVKSSDAKPDFTFRSVEELANAAGV